MTTGSSPQEMPSRAEPCRVFVLYERAPDRQRASRFCDQMIANFWSQLRIELDWCQIHALSQPARASTAIRQACEADVVVMATTNTREFQAHEMAWLQRWVSERRKHEGILVGLLEPAQSGASAPDRHAELHQLAVRAGMDYLKGLPEIIHCCLPEVPVWYLTRANEMSSVLNGIIQRPAPPPR